MSRLTSLDVLIVYNGKLALSASDKSANVATPFSSDSPNEEYNNVYAYFLKTCHQSGLRAGFATSTDIIGPGFCHSFWQLKDENWVKINSPCYSTLIFDKFSPTRKKGKLLRQLLFSSTKIKPFNNPVLFNLFFDKQKTYKKLSKYSIPTISLLEENNTLKSIKSACKNLAKLTYHHPTSADFSHDIVMKDRFGAGGRRIHKFKVNQSEDMLAVIRRHSNVSYIIQPFANFDKGFTYHHSPASTDIRLIYFGGKIVQSYIRVAKPGEFRCNEHRGGLLTYLSPGELPSSLIARANLIAKTLDKKHSLFTLDFIISNNGNSYFLEGNTSPGLDWNTSLKKNEIEAKKLIKMIVKDLFVRVKTQTPNQQESPTSNFVHNTPAILN